MSQPLTHDRQAILEALRLIAPTGVVELRALDCDPDSGFDRTVSGYFDANHHQDLAAAVERMCRRASGVYVTLQEVGEDCLARASNRARAVKKKDATTTDADVVAYRWLPLDFDPIRTKGVSSTDAEWGRAHEAARAVRQALTAEGWPAPVYASSGNGAHLLYRLPAGWASPKEGDKVQAALASLIARFRGECEGVDLDAKVFNPARIWKLYGTVARKGDPTPTRPHRLAEVLDAEAEPRAVDAALLDDLVAQGKQAQAATGQTVRAGAVAALASVAPAAPAPKLKPAAGTSAAWVASEDTPEKIADALACIPADDRDVWLAVGGALHHWGGAEARALWDDWAQSSAKFDPKGQDKAWASFGKTGRSPKTVATVYKLAQDNGWEHPATKAKRERAADRPRVIAQPRQPEAPPLAVAVEPEAQVVTMTARDGHGRLWGALEGLRVVRESEGVESAATADALADVADVARQVWPDLDPLEGLPPSRLMEALLPLEGEALAVWQRRCERAVQWAQRRATRPNWRTEDDKAADYLRAAARGHDPTLIALAAFEDPWRVAVAWALEAEGEVRASRLKVLTHILTVHGEFLKAAKVKEAAASMDLPADVIAALPTTMRPKLGTKAKAKAAPASRSVQGALPGCPANEAAVIPKGWGIRGGHVGRLKRDEEGNEHFESLCRALIIIAAQKDTAGMHWVTLAWRSWGEWATKAVPRAVICDRNQLMAEMPALGADVNSVNATDVVEWLVAFEGENSDVLPRSRVSAQMGWQGVGDSKGFLLGEVWVGREGEVIARADDPATWQDGAWSLACPSSEDLADARKFSASEGTLEGWTEVVAEVARFPRVMLALWASLAAPLVEIIGVRSPIVDWSGPPGTGKTSALHLAASVWGHPDEFGRGVMGSWFGTLVGHERRAALLGNLPIMLNDSNKAEKWVPGKVIYELAEGTGKQRGAAGGGRQAVARWSTVALSTGEQRLVDLADAKDAGTSHRVISLHGSPWGGWQGSAIEAMKSGLSCNYGVVGRAWIRALVAGDPVRFGPGLKERHRAYKKAYMDSAPNNAAAHRFADDFALFRLTIRLAHTCFKDWPWTVEESEAQLDDIFKEVAVNAVGLTAWEKAVGLAWDWAGRHPDRFWGRRKGRLGEDGKRLPPDDPPQGWAGSWAEGSGWTEISFAEGVLQDVFRPFNLSLDSIERDWLEQDVVRRDGRNTRPKVTMGSERQRLITIKRSAIRRICLGEHDESE